jgi:hypothetical protein
MDSLTSVANVLAAKGSAREDIDESSLSVRVFMGKENL